LKQFHRRRLFRVVEFSTVYLWFGSARLFSDGFEPFHSARGEVALITSTSEASSTAAFLGEGSGRTRAAVQIERIDRRSCCAVSSRPNMTLEFQCVDDVDLSSHDAIDRCDASQFPMSVISPLEVWFSRLSSGRREQTAVMAAVRRRFAAGLLRPRRQGISAVKEEVFSSSKQQRAVVGMSIGLHDTFS